jgi:hypothetical protein
MHKVRINSNKNVYLIIPLVEIFTYVDDFCKIFKEHIEHLI